MNHSISCNSHELGDIWSFKFGWPWLNQIYLILIQNKTKLVQRYLPKTGELFLIMFRIHISTTYTIFMCLDNRWYAVSAIFSLFVQYESQGLQIYVGSLGSSTQATHQDFLWGNFLSNHFLQFDAPVTLNLGFYLILI